MAWADAAGLFGVLMVLIAYAGAALGKLDPQRAPSLFANFAGSGLILLSLFTASFNLSAAVMEGAWCAVSLAGLARVGFGKLRK